ncbi:MAG: LLM class F420-dependent oxidoreductase [Ectothiorhodospiraceae bacterium]|nr:LLM class F420-dependent oxidoreductase [Chromatiales bacterium]MCP5155980.1 LLM class F420-dependent oxidoreductase [Ectothiorhodospiraceae bacterium]
MHLGVYIFPTDYSIRIDELARALEERGFESLFVPEHTHIPACRRSPWPGGGELPREYSHTLDPFVGLAVAAAVTTRLRVGTGICLLTERDPIVTAKEAASLDLLSGGRFELGIGAGWNAEEMENHGTAFETRFRVMCERAKAIRAIWHDDEASYHGEFVQFDRIWSWPKPVQRPNPPIILGGETRHTLRRVVEFCDGWMPRGRSFRDPAAEMARLRQHADEAGRDVASIATTIFGAPPKPEFLDGCRANGVHRALFTLPSEGRDAILPMLDKLAAHL